MKYPIHFHKIIYSLTFLLFLGNLFSHSLMAGDSDDEKEQKESSTTPSQASVNSHSDVDLTSNANLTPNTRTSIDYENLTLPQFLPPLSFPNGTRIDYDPVVRFPIYRYLGPSSFILFPSQSDQADLARALPFYSVIDFKHASDKIINRIPDLELVTLLKQFEENRNRLEENKVREIDSLKSEILKLTYKFQITELTSLHQSMQSEVNDLNSYAQTVCNENNPCGRLKRFISALEEVRTQIFQKIEELKTAESKLTLPENNLIGDFLTWKLAFLEKQYRELLKTAIYGPAEHENMQTSYMGTCIGMGHHSGRATVQWEKVIDQFKSLPNDIAAHRALFMEALEFQNDQHYQLFLYQFLSQYQDLFEKSFLPKEILSPFFDLVMKMNESWTRRNFLIFFDRQIIN